MRNLSTLTEVLLRGKILESTKSRIRSNTVILQFQDGSQANVDLETFNKLKLDEEIFNSKS